MGDLINADFRGKTWTKEKPKLTIAEGPTDFAALEAEICAALWCADVEIPIRDDETKKPA